MRRAAVIRGALLLLIFCPLEAVYAKAEFRSYHMTLAQTQEIILVWLKQNRFEVYRLDSRDRQVQLTAERNADRLQIDLGPHFPMATQVRIEPKSDAPGHGDVQLAAPAVSVVSMLRRHLQSHRVIPAGG